MDKLKEILIQVMGHHDIPLPKDIAVTANLTADLGLDSLALAELTVRVEDEFDIDVFEDGIVYTVQEIIDKIEK